MDMKEALEAVQKDGMALKDVPDELKTEELCMAAVQTHSDAFVFVPEELQTEEIAEEAAKRDEMMGWRAGY